MNALLTDRPYSDNVDVVARIARLSRVDRDGDVLLPGAVKRTPVTVSAWNHSSWDGALPLGRGVIAEEGDALVLRGELSTATQRNRDTVETLRGLGDLGEWSFAYDVKVSHRGTHDGQAVRFLEAIEVFEASPVLVGAGLDTGLIHLGAKARHGGHEVKSASGGAPRHPGRIIEVVELTASALAPDALRAVSGALDLGMVELGFGDEDIMVRFMLAPSEMPGLDTVAVPRTTGGAPVEQLAGMAASTGSDIWLRADMSAYQSAVTVAHELRHIWQRGRDVGDIEQDAEDFGQRIAARLLNGRN